MELSRKVVSADHFAGATERCSGCAVILLLTVAEVVAQSPAILPAQLEFEVAVVKKNVSGNPGASFGSQPGDASLW